MIIERHGKIHKKKKSKPKNTNIFIVHFMTVKNKKAEVGVKSSAFCFYGNITACINY